METILLNALAGNYRKETVNGREFIVAPLVSIVPGVLNGSKGALFYPEDEIARDPQAWNGMPLVKGHPTKNGQHISGRDPWVRANLQMGTIYNSVYDGKLQHEAWFDVEDTKRVDNWVYQQLINNRPIEVSTGLFTDNEPNRGTFNGRTYDYVARNYRPDHMAILVGQRGACSNDDGCGINVRNEESISLLRRISTTLSELFGITSNADKCPDCGAEMEDGECTECEYVENSINRDILLALNADDDITWITMGGAHIPIKGGKFLAGPFKGKSVEREEERRDEAVRRTEERGRQEDAVKDTDKKLDKSKEVHEKAKKEIATKHKPGDEYDHPEFGRVRVTKDGGIEPARRSTRNAGVYGNPQSMVTGKFKRHGAGTGKGDVHEAAQRGMMVLSDEDRQRGEMCKSDLANGGHNPASWVADEDKWEKAKAAADKGEYGDDEYWAVVSHIYKRMGGETKGTNNANPEGCNQYKDCGGGSESSDPVSTLKAMHTRNDVENWSYEKVGQLITALNQLKPADLKAAVLDVYGKDRDYMVKGSKAAIIERVANNLKERIGSYKIGETVDKSMGLNELTDNSRESDFIDCQEECDDMDCVDECLADFVGNNMPTTLAQLVTNAEDDGDVQWITIGGARIPIKGGKFAAGHMKGKEYKPKNSKDSEFVKKDGPLKEGALTTPTKFTPDSDIDPNYDSDIDPSQIPEESRGGAPDDADIHPSQLSDRARLLDDPNHDSDIRPEQIPRHLRDRRTRNLGANMPTRNEAIQTLVTNCDCWKGKQEVLANKDSFTDEDIQRLLKSFNARKLAVNTLREIGAVVKAPADLTVNNMPAFIKEKMGKAEEDEEQEVEDPTDEEEEEVMNNKKTTKNAAKSKKAAPITERLSPDELEVWNNAVKITANEKKKIVGQLVANLEGDYKREKFKKLMSKSMDDLREMLELRGVNNSEDDEPVSNGIGSFFMADPFDDSVGARTDNTDDDDGPPLGLPRMDYAPN